MSPLWLRPWTQSPSKISIPPLLSPFLSLAFLLLPFPFPPYPSPFTLPYSPSPNPVKLLQRPWQRGPGQTPGRKRINFDAPTGIKRTPVAASFSFPPNISCGAKYVIPSGFRRHYSHNRQIVSRRVARIFVRGDTTMEGPMVPSEARRREAPERREGWGLGRCAVAPPQYGCLGAIPQKIFEKSTLKLHIFVWF